MTRYVCAWCHRATSESHPLPEHLGGGYRRDPWLYQSHQVEHEEDDSHGICTLCEQKVEDDLRVTGAPSDIGG